MGKIVKIILVFTVLLYVGGCSSLTIKNSQSGKASWYGKKFQGKSTASGEKFDMNAMTAAHKSLPFGTRVEVTNLKNGKKVIVRINDRGPFVRGRIIDLSYAAAKKLDMINDGVVKVKIKILE